MEEECSIVITPIFHSDGKANEVESRLVDKLKRICLDTELLEFVFIRFFG